jgi:hypothetical protein
MPIRMATKSRAGKWLARPRGPDVPAPPNPSATRREWMRNPAALTSVRYRPYSIITLTDALAAVLGSVGGATVRASISA